MIEAWIDGTSFSSLGIRIKRRDIPPLPDTRDYTVQLAGKDGEVDFGSEYGPRIIQHECIIIADDSTIDYQSKVRQMAVLFNAKRGERILRYSDLLGKRYRARYAGTLPIEKVIFDGNFSLPMKMYDPFPESLTENIKEQIIDSSPEIIVIQSDGDLSASPIFTFTNVGNNTINGFTLTNEYEI